MFNQIMGVFLIGSVLIAIMKEYFFYVLLIPIIIIAVRLLADLFWWVCDNYLNKEKKW